MVIGLYGVPGSGKTHLLKQLEQELGEDHFTFYEGSTQIAKLVPGGLSVFRRLPEPEKMIWRQRAIDTIVKQSADNGKVGVVTGHLMFWPEGEQAPLSVYTQHDLRAFTYILYLDVHAHTIAQHRQEDQERSCAAASVDHLHNWQLAEKDALHGLCRQHGILFSLVSESPGKTLLCKIVELIHDACVHNEKYNLSRVESMLDEALATNKTQLQTMLILDADKTLAAEDTGALFWERVHKSRGLTEVESPMKTLFSSSLCYSYAAFRQATLLYEEVADDPEFEDICTDVASAVKMHPDFLTLLQLLGEQEHIGALVVTCGLRRVWEKVLKREGLSKTVAVIGGGRISDGIVVTAAVKGALVTRLRDTHRLHVWAFGDSPLDLDMLREAHQAIVVVGEERTRSRTMDAELINAIDTKGLCARQALLPSVAIPHVSITKLPVVQLTDPELVKSLLSHPRHTQLQFLHTTNRPAAKLLATSMRDANVSGPVLRKAHRRVGLYLATEILTDLIGLEPCPITHVLGHCTSGYRLFHESQVLIVALMRGGEPMAFGINEAFPSAIFLHAKEPKDIKPDHLSGLTTVILVDSVINSGKTVVEFVEQIRKLHATIRVVIVAGVVQDQTVGEGGTLHKKLGCLPGVSLVALRLSETKFTGMGGTDTGNRLFNTTHLD